MDAEEKKRLEEVEAVTSSLIMLAAVVSGVCGIALQLVAIGFQVSSFFNYGTYALRVFEIEPDFVGLALQLAVVIGILTVAISVTVGALALYKKKTPLNVCITLMFFMALIMGGFGGAILYLSTELDANIQSTGDAEAGELQAEISDYLLALYTECCEVQGNLVIGESDFLQECGASQPSATTTCFRDPNLYTYHRRSANAWVCGKLANATVNLDGVKIPNTNFDATLLTNGVTLVPIVGNAAAPTYGCGTGRALAFQYAFYVWYDQNIKPVAITSLACGVLQIVFIMAACASLCVSNTDDELSGLSMFQENNPYATGAYAVNAGMGPVGQHYIDGSNAQVPQTPYASPPQAIKTLPRDVDDKI